MMPRESIFMNQLLARFDQLQQYIRQAPIALGGSSGSAGGSGAPTGGFIGQLPQVKVAGDTTELFELSSGSASSLLWNLNRIRYWEQTQIAAVAPSPTFAGQHWVDTSGSLPYQLKIRNATDNGWIPVGEATVSSILFTIDGGGAVVPTGIIGDLVVDFDCTILSATLLADQTGSVVVDIWKDTYANYPPTDADSITASAPPTISGNVKSQDTTLTGWTTTISTGDILRFNVDSSATIERVLLALKVVRT